MAKILIIDDDGIVRDALAVFLSRAGHEVITAVDGANGLLAFKNNLPELVILDRDLPVLSGSAVLAGIREITQKTIVLILTGYDDPDDAAQYIKSGATGFLSKGDGLSNVLTAVDKVLGVSPRMQDGFKRAEKDKIPSAPNLTGHTKILIADDEESIRDILFRFLVSEGYDVIPVRDGGAALDAVEKEKPDIVLLDIQMPVKNGVEVLKEIREKNPRTGIVMITGNDDEELARQCLQNGASDYLPKPINLEALKNIIKARLLFQKQ